MGFEDQQGSSQTNNFMVKGYVTALAANAAATTGGADYTFGWQDGLAAATSVNHVFLQNNTNANVQFDFDVATSAGSPILAPGQTMLFDLRCTNLHLQSAANQNVNGTTANNMVVRGWL